MDRKAIVSEVNAFCEKHGVSVDDIVVGYGAAAVLQGLRQSTIDIDVDVHPSEFSYFTALPNAAKGTCLVGEFVSVGKIDVHVEEHDTDYELIDGLWVVGKRTLLRQYRWLFYHPSRSADKRKRDFNIIRSITREFENA